MIVKNLAGLKLSEIKRIVKERAALDFDAGPGWGESKRDGVPMIYFEDFTKAETEQLDEHIASAVAAEKARIKAELKTNGLSECGKNLFKYAYGRVSVEMPETVSARTSICRCFVETVQATHSRGDRGVWSTSPVPEFHRNGMELVFDKDIGVYRFVCTVHPVQTEPIPESARRRNWCRGRKRAEYVANAVRLFDSLVDRGLVPSECRYDEYSMYGCNVVSNWRLVFSSRKADVA